ncbi:phage distal tail protein [Streptomyces sp. S1]|uniref:phage distal tail protein n=1 Tax=Streptomyces sp. S1 TaxID=718288 RepID=UPI003D709911
MSYVAGQNLGGLRADIGPVPLGSVDSAGVAWRLQELQGWDSPEVRTEMQQREADHGAWSSPVYLGERPITAAGVIEAADRASLEDAMERLRSAVTLTDTLLVVYESTPKQAVVRRSGKLVLQYLTDRLASYSLMVTAPDPRRYATVLQSDETMLPITTGGLVPPVTPPVTIVSTSVSGVIDAPNVGSFETRPLFLIDGPVTLPKVLVQMPDGTVRSLVYSQSLGDGDQLVIDTDAHSVILNGDVSRRRFLSTPTGWPVIPPGSMVSIQFTAAAYSSGATLTARWRSAWM